MKIIHVISNLGNAGAEKFVVELSNAQSVEHEVSIISFRNIDDTMFPPKKLSKKVKLFELDKKKGFDFRVILKMIKIFHRVSPDVVNTHLDSVVRYAYIVSLLFPGPKYVQTIHNKLDSDKIKLFDRLKTLPFFKNRFNNVCISGSIYHDFCEKYKMLKFIHIDNGLTEMKKSPRFDEVQKEINAFKEQGNTVFVTIGRFDYQKNYPMLVSLFCRLKKEGKKLKLLIIGGELVRHKSEIQKVKEIICDNTVLLGQKENVADYLMNADAFIMSSRFEGMPIVILESLSVGLPVVTTPAGGVVDMIKDMENGFLAKTIEEDDLYDAIERFLNAPDELLEKIRKNNINAYLQKYSMESCSQKYLDLYKSI